MSTPLNDAQSSVERLTGEVRALVGREFRDRAEAAARRAEPAADRAEGAAGRAEGAATSATENATVSGENATRAEAAKTVAVEAEEGAVAGQELSEDSAAVAVAAAIGVQAAFHQHAGVGFPEGKVTAPVGAVYTDTAATNGAVRWVKTSGAGNTGWAVECGDTGWRDITALATTAPTSGRLLLSRDDTSLWLHFDQLTMPSSGSGAIITLPAGFRPQITQGATMQGVSSRVQMSTHGHVQIYNWTVSPMVGTITAKLPAGWPTTLPGTPV